MQVPDGKRTTKAAESGGNIPQNNSSVEVFNSVRQTSSSRLTISNIPSVGSNRASCEQPSAHQVTTGSDVQSTSRRRQFASSRSDGFIPGCSSFPPSDLSNDEKERVSLFASSRCNGESQGIT